MSKDEFNVAAIGRGAVMDSEHNLNVAFLRINLRTFDTGFHWLPDFFIKPLPEVVRQRLIERLRFHADRLESGELEKEMQQFLSLNRPGN